MNTVNTVSKEKVVLAYSGGLDTSVCIKWLQNEMGLDVIAMLGNVGQEHDGLEKVAEKAKMLGCIAVEVVDMTCLLYTSPPHATAHLLRGQYLRVRAVAQLQDSLLRRRRPVSLLHWS